MQFGQRTKTGGVPGRPRASRDRRESWLAERGHDRRWLILTVLAAVAFMAQLDLFIVNVAIPAIGPSFGARLSSLSWVLNGYAIVFAALLVPAGRLADHYGRRRFLLAGVLVFVVGSCLCAAAPTLGVLVAGRLVQAGGAAAIVPASLGLLLPVFPAHRHNLVVGVWAATAAVAASAGPPIGGLLIALSWRWIFLVNLPIGVFTLLLGFRILPEVRADRDAQLPDVISILALLAAVTLLSVGLVQGSGWGWASPRVIVVLGGALATAAITVRRSLTRPNAVIEARLFQNREFTGAALGLFLYFVCFSVFLLTAVLFLQDGWHYSAVRTGLAIVPGPVTSALFAINSSRISGRFGRTRPAVLGACLAAVSAVYWVFAAPGHPDYVTGFLPGMIIGGAGAGLIQAPLFAAASTLTADRATTGSAVLQMARQIGSAVGIAALVALIGTGPPDRLTVFHRAWVFQAIAAAGAAIAIARARSVNRRVRRRPAAVGRCAAGVEPEAP
ncbi:MAG: MFS transporter [Actinomycetota bacterium]|nr:MFS transporter [Actinomycetota bacterium]